MAKRSPLWTLQKNQISEAEYQELYKHISHDFHEPLIWSHNHVEGKQHYISLLYIPAKAPFDLWHQDFKHGLKLYVKRVFIMDDATQFLPRYLRFIKGVIDSSDLPLNISREILQDNKLVESIRSALVKRVLTMLHARHPVYVTYPKNRNFYRVQIGPIKNVAMLSEINSRLNAGGVYAEKRIQ